jgi:ParB-like chromosome segregation protein Spo0J
MEIVNRKLNSIKPYEKNPRKNDDAVKYVAESIKEFGFKVPIVIDSDGVIVAGHTRYKAAQMLKLKEVPCVIADDLTEEQVKAYRLADNKVSEAAEWDFDLLTEELENIFEIDMEAFGFMEAEEPEPKERKDLSGEVGEVFQIIVECNSELQQEEIYYKLINEGLQCRTLTL